MPPNAGSRPQPCPTVSAENTSETSRERGAGDVVSSPTIGSLQRRMCARSWNDTR